MEQNKVCSNFFLACLLFILKDCCNEDFLKESFCSINVQNCFTFIKIGI